MCSRWTTLAGSCGRTVLLCWAILLPGCLSSGTVEETAHVIPAHKPADFYDAVDAIESRWNNRADWQEDGRKEWREIVGWLPELAAQTELKKPDWDRVNAISLALSGQGGAAGATVDATVDEAAVSAQFADLRQLRDQAASVDKYRHSRKTDEQSEVRSEETHDRQPGETQHD